MEESQVQFTDTEQEEIDKFVAEYGNDVNVVNTEGETLLHKAAELGKIEVVKFLVANGVDVNAKTRKSYLSYGVVLGSPLLYAGSTPLHLAVQKGNVEVAQWLVSNGADVHAKDHSGDTPLHLAVWYGNVTLWQQGVEIAQFLTTKGANVHVKNNDGQTPLHLAAQKGNVEVAKLLVEKGADVYSRDKYDMTPLDIVKAEEFLEKHAENNGAMVEYITSITDTDAEEAEDLIQWCRSRAAQGDAESMYFLAVSYVLGKGVEKDYVEAVKWMRQAAEQGHGDAQLNLGNAYAEGYGVEVDHTEAVRWFQKAADQGLAAAQFNLGNAYAKGHGVEVDNDQAVRLYQKAAEQGLKQAQRALDYIEINKMEDPISRSRKAAELGHTQALFDLFRRYDEGDGVDIPITVENPGHY